MDARLAAPARIVILLATVVAAGWFVGSGLSTEGRDFHPVVGPAIFGGAAGIALLAGLVAGRLGRRGWYWLVASGASIAVLLLAYWRLHDEMTLCLGFGDCGLGPAELDLWRGFAVALIGGAVAGAISPTRTRPESM